MPSVFLVLPLMMHCCGIYEYIKWELKYCWIIWLIKCLANTRISQNIRYKVLAGRNNDISRTLEYSQKQILLLYTFLTFSWWRTELFFFNTYKRKSGILGKVEAKLKVLSGYIKLFTTSDRVIETHSL